MDSTKGMGLLGTKQALYNKVVEAVESEIHHASAWDEVRKKYNLVASKKDEDKSFEDWMSFAILELDMARRNAYYSFSKVEAIEHVRKAVGHLFRMMMYFGVRKRTPLERDLLVKKIERNVDKSGS